MSEYRWKLQGKSHVRHARLRELEKDTGGRKEKRHVSRVCTCVSAVIKSPCVARVPLERFRKSSNKTERATRQILRKRSSNGEKNGNPSPLFARHIPAPSTREEDARETNERVGGGGERPEKISNFSSFSAKESLVYRAFCLRTHVSPRTDARASVALVRKKQQCSAESIFVSSFSPLPSLLCASVGC